MEGNLEKSIGPAYKFKGESIQLGCVKYQEEIYPDLPVNLPLKMFNRHGLVSGATGSGKTKTLQILAEHLSDKGIPSLLLDIKGDLSGIAAPSPGHPKIDERQKALNLQFVPSASPVELLTLQKSQPGLRLRSTVSEIGPILLSRMLELNETQTSIISMVFQFCDDQKLALLDLKDLKSVLDFLSDEGKDEFKKKYGQVSPASVGTILRKVIQLEQQGAEDFFGEPSFDIDDLMRQNKAQKGIVSILRSQTLQSSPHLFSTFMLSLLAEVYESLPEAGDGDKPKLIIFIDEAHLIFKDATKALLSQIETMVKLIRSKQVGLFFCTQNPTDIPSSVLAQLGMKIQHSLRAFTAKDRKNIKLSAENFPLSEFYEPATLLTELGIGEALVSCLDEKGRPTPLVYCHLRAPVSRMDILSEQEIHSLISKSEIHKNYDKDIDRESAYEVLEKKIAEVEDTKEDKEVRVKKPSRKSEESWFSSLSKNTMIRQIGRTITRELTRGILGTFGISSTKRRRRKRRY